MKAAEEQIKAQEQREKADERKQIGVAGHREDDFLARARLAEAGGT